MPSSFLTTEINEEGLRVGAARALLLFFLFLPVWGQALKNNKIKPEEIELLIGVEKIIELDFIPFKNVSVGNESAIQASLVLKDVVELVVKGIKPLKSPTNITVRDRQGNVKREFLVTVVENEKTKLVSRLEELIGDVEGIEIGIKGGLVYVGGKLVVPADIGQVATVLSKQEFSDILFLVELSDQTKRLIARKMQTEIQQRARIQDVTVRLVNGTYWLEGVVNSEGQKTKAEEIAKAFFPDLIPSLAQRTNTTRQVQRSQIQNFIQVNIKPPPKKPAKLIKITAQFVELQKDYQRIFGFRWNPLFTDGGGTIRFGERNDGTVSTRSDGTLSGVISNLFPRLASAKSAGYARVVQQGVVILKNGENANLEKSEVLPISVGSGDFAQPGSAEAGFNLGLNNVTIGEQESIDMEINLSVKTIVQPGNRTQNNSLKTKIVIKSKESAVIGGITVNTNAVDYNKDPPGGVTESEDNATQSIFDFLRQKSNAVTKSQFVFFLTPEIIQSASEGTEAIKRKFRRRSR